MSAEERNWLDQNSGKLTLWFNTSFPPVEFSSSVGDFTGMGADIIALVEKRLGVTFNKYSSDDWNRHLAALKSGACAIAPTIVATPERGEYAFFTDPYARVPVVIIANKDLAGDLTLADFTGRRVAVVSGFASEKYVRDIDQGRFEVVPVADVSEGLHQVAFGQVDVFVENLAVAAWYIDKEGIPNLRVAGSTDFVFAWSIGVSRKYPLLYSAIQKAFDSISEGEINSIHKRWITLDISSWLDPKTRHQLQVVNVLVTLVLIGMVVVSVFLRRSLKKKVAQLREQAERLQLATEASRAGVWEYYPGSQTCFLSKQWFRNLGYPEVDKKINLSEIRNLVHPEDLPAVDRAFRDYISGRGRGELEIEFRFCRADDDWCWVLSKSRSIEWDENGIPSRIIGLDLSIHDIKDAQEKIAQSEAKLRAIFDNAPYSIAITRLEDGAYLEANKAFLESRGITREQLPHLRVQDFTQASIKELAESVDMLLKKGSVRDREVSVVNADGQQRHIIYSSVLLEIQGQKQVLSMTVDVTQRIQAEKELKESERRFRTLFKMAPVPMFNISRDGKILEVNDRMTRIMGYTLEEIPTLDKFWELGFPDSVYRSWARSKWEAAILNGPRSDADEEMREYRIIGKDGVEHIMAASSNVIGESLIVSFFNMTERQKADEEREKLKEQLHQSQKLEAIGILAGGVAHDFNNMLGSITGYAELTLGEMEPSNRFRPNLVRILDAARRSASLTHQLLAFARKQTIEPILFDINESIDGLLNMIHRLIGENIEIAWRPAEDSLTVKMDPSQFDQILVNLCVNAKDAIDDVGRISIETDKVYLDQEYGDFHAEFTPGEYALLVVSDNGRGMDKDTLKHIFEPFFTTKGAGRGTGLGLATVYGIVQQNEGFINVYSEPGKGTTFRIYMPIHAANEVVLEKAVGTAAIPRSHGETILIIEDDPILLEMGRLMLERLGYSVITAATPKEAIELVEENSSK
ncbi:MAG: transporter substrate-binding domain-containing protein, partial [Deltaproteobacteria bacterium]|nr:transporter substrate-binding domain-containing protein [Deltaproteobacteria bacterium]